MGASTYIGLIALGKGVMAVVPSNLLIPVNTFFSFFFQMFLVDQSIGDQHNQLCLGRQEIFTNLLINPLLEKQDLATR